MRKTDKPVAGRGVDCRIEEGAVVMHRRFLTAAWRYLVMLNYEIDPAVLSSLVPKGTELDPFAGRHYVSLVGFRFLDTRVLGLPIPGHRNFDEVNLRFYVRHRAADGWRRGVAFIKEVVPRRAIAALARWLYNENYVACPMQSTVRLPESAVSGRAEYRWAQPAHWHALSAEFTGAPCRPASGSEAEFITEHYWGYVAQRDGGTVEYRVEHPPWAVWSATGSALSGDIATFYGETYREVLVGSPRSAFVAEGSEVTVYRGVRIAS
jgi:uncharacterized protein YqjF (DUF2071 family)